MRYSTQIWDAQSGETRPLGTVEAESGAWQRGRVIDQAHVFPLRSLGLSRSRAHDLFGRDRPRDRVLCVLADDKPVYHGLIINSDYSADTGKLTVTHKDVRELAATRWLFGIGASSQTWEWAGLSWRGIARAVAKIIFTDPISDAWPLPVTLPASEAGDETFKTYGYEFRHGESLLKEIEEMPGGPDLDFHPMLVNGKFGWELRIGSPFLEGPEFTFHLQAPHGALTDVGVKTVGDEKFTGVHGVGDGSEWDMVRGGAAAPVSAGLARDTKLTLKSDDLAKVNKRSAGYLDTRLETYQQWSFSARTDRLDVTRLRLGSIITIQSQGDEWIDDGYTRHRVLGFGGNITDPDSIDLTVEKVKD